MTRTYPSVALVLLLLALAGAAFAVEPHPKWRNALKPKGEPGPLLALAREGGTDYRILLAASPTTMDEKAAQDLATWLKGITGAEFPVVREGAADAPSGKVISIGKTRLYERSGVPRPAVDLRFDGYAIQAKGDTLFLTGGRRRGIINAVYALLEEDLGCRWYALNVDPVLPKRPTLRFRPALRAFRPPFEDRRDPYTAEAWHTDWALRNRTYGLNDGVPAEWGGHPKSMGFFVHSYDLLVPAATYFEQHPEWFSEVGGKRQPFQLCTTNPEVRKLIVGKVLAHLREHPDTQLVDVSPNDRRDYCECAACKAIDDAEGTKMGSLLTLVNLVADAVRPNHPDVKITTLAYLDTIVPPKTIRPAGNVLFWMCTDAHAWSHPNEYVWETDKFSKALKDWHRIGAKMVIWDYPSSFNYLQPNLNLSVVAENVRYYLKHGATGVMYQCAHDTNHGADHSLLRAWVWAKQAWDPSLDTQALVRDFNYGFYGKVADRMQAYDDMLSKAWREWRRNRKRKDYKGPVTPEFVGRAYRPLTEAEQAAGGEAELTRRVQVAKLPLQFLKAQEGPKGDNKEYLAMLDEFERVARGAGVRYVENAFQGPDLDKKLTYWRAVAKFDASRLYSVPLPSAWRFRPDEKDAGVAEKWYGHELDDSRWAAMRSDTGNGWESQGFKDTHGYGWYRMKLTVTDDLLAKENLRLFFGAVDEQAWVYLNGQLAFEHTVATTGQPVEQLWTKPFQFDPKPFLKPGENLLAVRVHDTLGMAGIWKPAYLLHGETDTYIDLMADALQRRHAPAK